MYFFMYLALLVNEVDPASGSLTFTTSHLFALVSRCSSVMPHADTTTKTSIACFPKYLT